MNSKPYMNPYLAGLLLGLVLLITIYITGRGLGASGAVKDTLLATVKTAAPEHFNSDPFYQEYSQNHEGSPLRSWLVFQILGLIVGAFLSGIISNRVGFRFEKGPGVKNSVRLGAAILGGLLFGFGSQLGRGCTSGSALSGMAVMSFGGIITMMAIFGSAYGFAFFVRKLWIKGQ
jgi:uncharacterized membrane protein YedE/YeeE